MLRVRCWRIYDITDEEEAFKRQAYIGGVLFWKRDYDDYLKIIPIEYPNVKKHENFVLPF